MTNISPFKKATKKSAKAKIALTGPSGSGKTLSALLLAKGLGGKCCVIDTENGSASLYTNHRLLDGFEYDVAEISPPYDVKKYLALIEAAHKAGYETMIIDSLTHAWAGEGGMLQKKEALDSRGGNSFSNWGAITKEYEKLKSYLLHSKVHVITTMRSKQEYILENNDKGKQAPKKVGLAPIMRDGMEYEFTVVFDIGMDHQFMASKDRTDLFDGVVATITEDTGAQIKQWLSSESEPPPPPPPQPEDEPQQSPADEPQAHPDDDLDAALGTQEPPPEEVLPPKTGYDLLNEVMEKHGVDPKELPEMVKKVIGPGTNPKKLDNEQIEKVINFIKMLKKGRKG